MKLYKIISVLILTASVSGCTLQNETDVHRISAEPYSAFTDDGVGSKECRIEFGDEVFISGSGAWFGADGIKISEGGVYNISGSYNGCIYVTASDPVKLVFISADITNDSGCAIASSSEKLVIASENGISRLSGCGSDYMTAVDSKGVLVLTGSGTLMVDAGAYAGGGILFGRNVNTFCEIIHSDQGDLIYGQFRIN